MNSACAKVFFNWGKIYFEAQSSGEAGGEVAASPRRVDKAWTVGGGACEGSDTSANWLLQAVTDGCGW